MKRFSHTFLVFLALGCRSAWAGSRDDVDFQRGELEWEGGNIYFDNYTNGLEVREAK
jgi:hypothetical protein